MSQFPPNHFDECWLTIRAIPVITMLGELSHKINPPSKPFNQFSQINTYQ